MGLSATKHEAALYKVETFLDQLTEYSEENTNVQIWFNLLEPISSFTGREEDLNKLNESVSKNQITVVSGFGGIGKTEFVRYYTWQHKAQFDNNVAWINAESKESLMHNFKQFGVELRVPSKNNGDNRSTDAIIRDIYNKLNETNCLIVFDNATNQKEIKAYLPQTNVKTIKVLITSQNRDWKAASVIDLSVLNVEDAYKFLRNNLQESLDIEENKTHIEKLAKALGYLPLALQQAVAYINYKILDLKEKFSVLEYIEKYEKKKMFNFYFDGNSPFPDSNENSYDQTLFQSVSQSVDLIEKSATCPDLALDILHICSYLAPNNIPKRLFDPLEKDEEDSVNTCLYVLTKYALLQKFEIEDQWEYNIHRLVQLAYRYIKTPKGFCPETAKKTMLLTTKNIVSNLDHYTHVLDFIMNRMYFESEIVEELLDYKVCCYALLKTMPIVLKDFVKLRNESNPILHEELEDFLTKILSTYRNLFFTELMEIDFLVNPTYDAANQLLDSLVKLFIETQQTGSLLLKKDLSAVLIIASFFGDLNLVQYVINRGVNVNIQIEPDKVTTACMANKKIKLNIENKFQFNLCLIAGETPLSVASANGHSQIAQFLIKNGADVNKVTKNCETLHAASRDRLHEFVQSLAESNCKENILSKYKQTALLCAAEEGHSNIEQYSIKHGANVKEDKMDNSFTKKKVTFLQPHITTLNLGLTDTTVSGETTDNPIFFNIIETISSFTGREEDLKKLSESVFKSVITVVSGFGGIGKTELVRFYAWRQKTQLDVVWINAESESSLKSCFQQLAAELRIESTLGGNEVYIGIERSINAIIQEIYNKLNKRKVLIVFDNAINRKKIQKYLPQTSDENIKVLITSQNRDWKKDYVIELSVWNEEDACKFLRNNLLESCNTEEKKKEIERLAKELQYLPLALQQAVAYINYKIEDLKEEFSVLKYIEEYERKQVFDFHFQGNSPFPDSEVNSYDKTLFQSVTLSVDLITKTATCPDLTLDIFHLCSYLAPDNIPKSIFDPLEKDEELLNTCLYVLTKYFLLQKFRNKDEWCYNIHRLVQLSYRYIKNPNGFCEKTAKKTMLLISDDRKGTMKSRITSAEHIVTYINHYYYVLDFIMKKLYFDREIAEEILDYKVCCYGLLKTMPFILKDVKHSKYSTVCDVFEKEEDYTLLFVSKSLIKINLNYLGIDPDPLFYLNHIETHELIYILVPIFLDTEQPGSNLFKKDLSVALLIASFFGCLKIVKYAKERGVNINTQMEPDAVIQSMFTKRKGTRFDGANPLYFASWAGHLHIAQYLIDNGADVNKANINLETPLHAAACNGHYEVVQVLVENECDVNALSKNNQSALFHAAYEGRLHIVEYLIKNGANINERNTPLHAAAQNGHYEVVQFLVENECDVNVLSEKKQSALLYAACKGHLEIVRYLIKNGANINERNINGLTPLHAAAGNGHYEVVQLLVENQCDVNILSEDEESALSEAACKGHLNVVEYLTKNGANIHAQDGHHYMQPLKMKMLKTNVTKNILSENEQSALSKGYLNVVTKIDIIKL